MLLELHAHSREHSPCSKIGAVDLVTAAISKGLDGLVLTDHHYLWSMEEIQSLRSATSAPVSFILAAGQEVTTSDVGDVLVYGAPVTIGPGPRLRELRLDFPEAAIVLAHPWRGQNRPSMVELFDPNIDAVEVLNRHHRFSLNRRALREWFMWGFVAIGGTDSHDHKVGIYPTFFPDGINTMSGVVDSIKEGSCRPLLKSKRYRHFMS